MKINDFNKIFQATEQLSIEESNLNGLLKEVPKVDESNKIAFIMDGNKEASLDTLKKSAKINNEYDPVSYHAGKMVFKKPNYEQAVLDLLSIDNETQKIFKKAKFEGFVIGFWHEDKFAFANISKEMDKSGKTHANTHFYDSPRYATCMLDLSEVAEQLIHIQSVSNERTFQIFVLYLGETKSGEIYLPLPLYFEEMFA
ncbi:hypothetical protein [Acinetobacter sp. TSRC1-2]|uniref:hypothetical protein n=1 Tax=unclassified Acinetobacter TaxID=196816 RepID=UPI003CED61D7